MWLKQSPVPVSVVLEMVGLTTVYRNSRAC